jgi:nucleoside-diphosphate-sugar epimerase
VLVLGADNFVGRPLTTALTTADWAEPVTPTSLRADDESALYAALGGIDAVANCVTGSPAFLRANAQALFGAAARVAKPPRIVHFSSMTVYGNASGDIDEQSPLRDELGPYAAAKIEAERIAVTYPRAVLLRPGCEYGPGCPQWSERVARWVLARRLGDLGAGGDGSCNLIHIDDLIAAFVSALRRDGIEGQSFNLALPTPPTWNEYFTLFARALRAVPVRRISQRRLSFETRLLAPPLKVTEILTNALGLRRWQPPPAIPPSVRQLCTQEIRLVSHKAEKMLGLQWTPLDRGLRETAAWFLALSATAAAERYVSINQRGEAGTDS